MEDVFLDFELDEYYDHIDNRGWMNLFQHWAWSGMLCATWAMTGSTFDPRFQRFCWTRLDLRPGRPSVADMQAAVTLPDPDQWRRGARPRGAERRLRGTEAQPSAGRAEAGLNFWEAELVAKYMRATRHAGAEAVSRLPHGREPAPRPTATRCASTSATSSATSKCSDRRGARAFVLHYMRIQNHLRKMGLARDALMALRDGRSASSSTCGDPLFDATRCRRHGLGRSACRRPRTPSAGCARIIRSLPRSVSGSSQPDRARRLRYNDALMTYTPVERMRVARALRRGWRCCHARSRPRPGAQAAAGSGTRRPGRTAAPPRDRAPSRSCKLRADFYAIVGAGANIAVQIGPDGVVVVDTGSGERSADVVAEIRKLTPRPDPLHHQHQRPPRSRRRQRRPVEGGAVGDSDRRPQRDWRRRRPRAHPGRGARAGGDDRAAPASRRRFPSARGRR